MTSFMMVPHDLFRTQALSLHDKMTLLAIIDVGRADMPNRWNRLSTDKMMRHTGMSRASCYRSIKSLEDVGAIVVLREHQRAPQYQVQWDALSTLVEAAALLQTPLCVSEGDSSVSHRDESVSHRDSSVSEGDSEHSLTRGNKAPNKSSSRSSKKKSYEQPPSSPRSNLFAGTCCFCSYPVEKGTGRLVGKKPAHLDGECPSEQTWY